MRSERYKAEMTT